MRLLALDRYFVLLIALTQFYGLWHRRTEGPPLVLLCCLQEDMRLLDFARMLFAHCFHHPGLRGDLLILHKGLPEYREQIGDAILPRHLSQR